ncbi:hypothetical protein EHQ12_17160 [Leptospira gomenensis]|uniref:Lipoprotein n=1 Tax=Leptospira gomenensis TaxID=2484974 RepID=A0A5F1YFG5_9LEPT|nr:hypothetical protein EHQ12_17160 [Leptospira gomenensis]TGK38515.1 hypothetical protein EHQ17_02160 [Leptospira gomenensis]TGK42667.1 hypothetical protein EHQ07_14255 [Leptospira gomenensis]TGK55874.1 hypothetical protein EHQ13_16275 [Leptospira gomenensis]
MRFFVCAFEFSCAILLVYGCHSTVIVHKETVKPLSGSHAPTAPDRRAVQANTLFGIYSLSDSEMASCQDLPGEVKMFRTIRDSLVHFMIGPFYTTKTVEVYCAPGKKKEEKEDKTIESKTTQKEESPQNPQPETANKRNEEKEKSDSQENKDSGKDGKESKDKSKSRKKQGDYIFDSQF